MRQKAVFFLFFASHKINKSLLKSEKNQHMKKTVFYNFNENLENKNVLYEDKKHQIPFYIPFVEQKKEY